MLLLDPSVILYQFSHGFRLRRVPLSEFTNRPVFSSVTYLVTNVWKRMHLSKEEYLKNNIAVPGEVAGRSTKHSSTNTIHNELQIKLKVMYNR